MFLSSIAIWQNHMNPFFLDPLNSYLLSLLPKGQHVPIAHILEFRLSFCTYLLLAASVVITIDLSCGGFFFFHVQLSEPYG